MKNIVPLKTPKLPKKVNDGSVRSFLPITMMMTLMTMSMMMTMLTNHPKRRRNMRTNTR